MTHKEPEPLASGDRTYFYWYVTPSHVIRDQIVVFPPDASSEFITERKMGVARMIANIFEDHENRMRAEHRRNPTQMKAVLAQMREELHQETGKSVSRPALCAAYLADVLSQMHEDLAAQAISPLGVVEISQFVAHHDFSVGLYAVATGIWLAEAEVQGATEKIALRLLDEQQKATRKVVLAEQFDREYPVFKAEAEELAALLIKRPDGFAVVDNIADKIQQEVYQPELPQRMYRVPPILVPDFVLAGARQAQRMYEEVLYPSSI